MQGLTKVAVFAGLFTLMLLWTGMPAGAEEMQHYGPIPGEKSFEGVAFRSGGIGTDEREVLKQFEYQYSLKLVFSTDEGKYMAQVPVIIRDWTGKTVLEATSQGPWFYVRLPAGKYTVEAWNRDDPRSRTIRIGTSGLTTVHLSW